MDHCNLLQNAAVSAYDNHREFPVVCPKPRRIGVLTNNPNRPLRLHLSHHSEMSDMSAGAELFEIILKKEDFGKEPYADQVASPSQFFHGSPPRRVSNPLVHDAQFGVESLAALQISSSSSPASSSLPKGESTRTKFAYKPATVRVEGFNCLNRNRQSSSITAMA